MIPNREESGKWGRSGKCFSRAFQRDTVIPEDISQNHHLEARVTVRTLPPLPPLPPFWTVDDELPDAEIIPQKPLEVTLLPVADAPSEREVATKVADSLAQSVISDEERASLKARADYVEPVARPIVTPGAIPKAAVQPAVEEELDDVAQEHAEWVLRVEAGRADAEAVPQSIAHVDMMAGLRAVSKTRPAAIPTAGNGKPEPLLTAERRLGDNSVAQPSAADNSRGWEIALPSVDQSDPWAAGIAHLQTMPPLEGFTLSQWRRVQHGCAALLTSHDAEMRRLGWTMEDGFGIHPRVPAAGVHCYGLGVMLGDSRVIEMTEKGARIFLRSGVTQTFTRLPSPWAVPIWTVSCSGLQSSAGVLALIGGSCS